MKKKNLSLFLIIGVFIFRICLCPTGVLVDTTKKIDPVSYYYVSFRTGKGNITVHYRVRVLRGPNVDVYILDEVGYDKYKLFGEGDRAIIGREGIREIEGEVILEEDTLYYLVVENPSWMERVNVSIFLESESKTTISVLREKKDTFLGLKILILFKTLMICVVFSLVLYLMAKSRAEKLGLETHNSISSDDITKSCQVGASLLDF